MNELIFKYAGLGFTIEAVVTYDISVASGYRGNKEEDFEVYDPQLAEPYDEICLETTFIEAGENYISLNDHIVEKAQYILLGSG